MDEHLFVGGPFDGRRVACNPSRPYAIPEPFDANAPCCKLEHLHWYHPHRFALGDHEMTVFVLAGTADVHGAVSKALSVQPNMPGYLVECTR